jgi:hypothetical protein
VTADAARLGSLGRFLTPEPAGEPRVPFGTVDAVTSGPKGATAKALIFTAQSRGMSKRHAIAKRGGQNVGV